MSGYSCVLKCSGVPLGIWSKGDESYWTENIRGGGRGECSVSNGCVYKLAQPIQPKEGHVFFKGGKYSPSPPPSWLCLCLIGCASLYTHSLHWGACIFKGGQMSLPPPSPLKKPCVGSSYIHVHVVVKF